MCVIVGLVPIVRGKFPRYEKHVPPGSFINADSFFSYADLAEYLKYLMQTPEAYNKFFEWRRWVWYELWAVLWVVREFTGNNTSAAYGLFVLVGTNLTVFEHEKAVLVLNGVKVKTFLRN